MARLGASYIDLYLLAIKQLGSFALRQETESDEPVRDLAHAFVELLEEQSREPGFNTFYELSQAAQFFDLLVGVNFPDVRGGKLDQLALRFGSILQRQVPVGRMSGGVNKRLVSQFRMPGFPLALVTTDVLQEGEDLHTFLSAGRALRHHLDSSGKGATHWPRRSHRFARSTTTGW